MVSLQKIKAKRAKSSGRGAAASYRWQKQISIGDRRTTLRLGLLSEKAAKEVSGHIDHLIEATRHSTRIEAETKAWLRSADSKLVEKLHSLGLCPRFSNPTVADFTQAYIDSKALKVAKRTVVSLSHARTNLIGHLGSDIRMDSVTANDAVEFFDYLIKDAGLNENTARGRFSKVRQMFNNALERDVITRNPFKLASCSVSVGAAKKDYVPESVITETLDHCPTTEWKLLFMFGRFVGCRMPSEIQGLIWADVNWEKNTILIRSPKTERRGKASRLVPIFPQIRPHLEKQFEQARKSTKQGKLRDSHVFPTLRHHTNAATTAKKYVEAAGFAAWDKFWNSLRASRETDLMDAVGLRRACQWIGNSPKVAMANYALMKSTDYIDAGANPKSDAKSDAAPCRIGENGDPSNSKTPGKPTITEKQVAEAGLETLRYSQGKRRHSEKSDAKSDALNLKSDALPSDEVALLNAWRSADEATRRRVLSVLGLSYQASME